MNGNLTFGRPGRTRRDFTKASEETVRINFYEGLSSHDVKLSEKKYGKNTFTKKKA